MFDCVERLVKRAPPAEQKDFQLGVQVCEEVMPQCPGKAIVAKAKEGTILVLESISGGQAQGLCHQRYLGPCTIRGALRRCHQSL